MFFFRLPCCCCIVEDERVERNGMLRGSVSGRRERANRRETGTRRGKERWRRKRERETHMKGSKDTSLM